jgi:CRP/FNR family transcriptional regulator
METQMLMTSPEIDPQCMKELGVSLKPEELEFLLSLGTVKEYEKDTLLTHNGDRIDKLMFLTKGRASLVMTGTDGSEKICLYFSAGTFIGEAGFFHGQPVIFDLHGLEDSQVLYIEKKRIDKMLLNPNIVLYLVTQMALGSRVIAYQLEDATFRTTKQTVCRILYCLSSTEHQFFKPHFTHQEIADLAGVHRVTVTNTLAVLKNEGIVKFQPRGHIEVLDRDKLYEKIYRTP